MMTVQKLLNEDKATIINMISSGLPLKETLNFILTSLENYCDRDKVSGSIMMYNPLSNQLAETVSPSLPKSFINAIEPVDISPYGGSSGTAAYLKQPVIVSDIENNPLWEKYRHIAIVHGFRACLSIPLLSSTQELLGTIELYSNQIGGPDEETLKIVDVFSKIASLTIEIFNNQNVQLLYSFEIENR